MKKMVIILLVMLCIYMCFNKMPKLPDDAIRFRILANSNSPRDQKIKEDVKNKMQEELYMILRNAKTNREAKDIITSNMDNFDKILLNEMKDKEYSYKIDYGYHYFPKKTYNGVTYDEGEYESLLVTLGEGKGDNWWCVLFPPLCIVEAKETDEDDITYKSFIKEKLEKYF